MGFRRRTRRSRRWYRRQEHIAGMLATRLLLIGSATVAVAGLIAVAVGQWELRLEASDVLPSPPNV